MYKILNKLFGYDYIQWRNSADSGIARVHKDSRGVVFYWRYKSTKLADTIEDEAKYLWLTCDPDKYLG